MSVKKQFICSPSNCFAVFHRAKENGTSQRVEKHEQEHAKYNEKRLVDGDADREHKHFEGGVFAGDGEETQNHYHEADAVAQVVLRNTTGSKCTLA